jgi:hypothetical protein
MKFQKVMLGALLGLLVLAAQAQAQMVPRSVTGKALLPPPARAAAPIAKPAAPAVSAPSTSDTLRVLSSPPPATGATAVVQSAELTTVKNAFLTEARGRWKLTDNELYCAAVAKSDPKICAGESRSRVMSARMVMNVSSAKVRGLSPEAFGALILPDLQVTLPVPRPQIKVPMFPRIDTRVLAQTDQRLGVAPGLAQPKAEKMCVPVTHPNFYVEVVPINTELTVPPRQAYPFRLGGEFMSPFVEFDRCLIATIHPMYVAVPEVLDPIEQSSSSMRVTIQAAGIVNGRQTGAAVVKNILVQPSTTNPPTITIPIMRHDQFAQDQFVQGIITKDDRDLMLMNPNPAVDAFPVLPPLCPRLTLDTAEDATKGLLIYDAAADPFLSPYPRHQEVDPDFLVNSLLYQASPLTHQDIHDVRYIGQQEIGRRFFSSNPEGCHELMIDTVKAKFDYEDEKMYVSQNQNSIVREFITKITHADNTTEGFGPFGGGTSSNFYFIAMPCQPQYISSNTDPSAGLVGMNYEPTWKDYGTPPSDPLGQDPQLTQIQPFQHLLQGQLDYLSCKLSVGCTPNNSLADYTYSPPRPSHRVMSFLPALFEGETSREDLLKGQENEFYTKCEWMDTSSQAPDQEVHYKNLAIWDWALSDPAKGEENNCAIVSFIEGDEDNALSILNALPNMAGPLIPENFLSDDLLATFVVRRADLANGPVEYKNTRHAPQEYVISGDQGWDFAVTFSKRDMGPGCREPKRIPSESSVAVPTSPLHP